MISDNIIEFTINRWKHLWAIDKITIDDKGWASQAIKAQLYQKFLLSPTAADVAVSTAYYCTKHLKTN